MRSIKFKVWDGKKMHHNAIVGNGQVLYIPDATGEYKWASQADVTPLEYSEQPDVKGNPIFEGDIVLHGESVRTVEKIDSRWTLVSLDRENGILLSFSKPKIIGNIYENPQLLVKNVK